jgi:colicin import membrane protein
MDNYAMSVVKKSLLSCLLFALMPMAYAEEVYPTVRSALVEVYPAGSIVSSEQADAALSIAARLSTDADNFYLEQQRLCYDKFFLNYCLNVAKDNHRVTMNAIKTVEIQANRFQRQLRADEADRRIAERQANREAVKP